MGKETYIETVSYPRDSEAVRGYILNLVAKNRQTVYGMQSVNHSLPIHLRKQTKDVDILTKNPKYYAEQAVRGLNKGYGVERFKVTNAVHKGTFRVRDIKTGEVVADFTKSTKSPSSYNSLGVRYAKESYSERKLKKILKDPNSKFRWEKDKDTLNRIQQIKRLNKF